MTGKKNEIWKSVVGWEDYYSVSSLGNLKTIKQIIKTTDGRIFERKEKIRKLSVLKRGYPIASLKISGRKTKLVPVHLLVAEAFLGIKPFEKAQVRHLDGNKLNNKVSNLTWGTASENQQDRVSHNTSNRGEKCGTSFLKEEDVRQIRNLRTIGLTHKEIGMKFNISREHARDICNGKRWGWLDEKI